MASCEERLSYQATGMESVRREEEERRVESLWSELC